MPNVFASTLRANPLYLMFATATILASLGGVVWAQPVPVQTYQDVPVHITTPFRPVPVEGSDGKTYVVYHLFLTNLTDVDLTLEQVVVADALKRAVIDAYAAQELADPYRFESPLLYYTDSTARPSTWSTGVIPAGRTAGLYFWLAFDAHAEVPSNLAHELTFRSTPRIRIDGADGMSVRSYVVPIPRSKPIEISPPVLGEWWRCSNGPGYKSDHQGVFAVRGVARNPQRFAIDFQRVDESENRLPNPFPNEISNDMFYTYEQPVFAVADGIVERVVDGIPDNVPQASGKIVPAVPLTRETNAGNTIALRIGDGQYAYYAHLKAGSITVKAGDLVKNGQRLAVIGNSGNSVGPHLHFQIGDRLGVTLNEVEGLPFTFRRFKRREKPLKTPIVAAQHTAQMPLDGDVLSFGH